MFAGSSGLASWLGKEPSNSKYIGTICSGNGGSTASPSTAGMLSAPAPVTAVFAGLLTKVGVYAILRMQTLLFPDSPLTDLLLWAALLTMIIGILGAIAQAEIKRLEAEVKKLREDNEILRSATVFFAGELDPRNR